MLYFYLLYAPDDFLHQLWGKLDGKFQLDDIKTAVSGSVQKMLNEKTFPKNVLSLRMAIEYFQPYLKDMDEAYELDDFLNKIKESKTSKV